MSQSNIIRVRHRAADGRMEIAPGTDVEHVFEPVAKSPGPALPFSGNNGNKSLRARVITRDSYEGKHGDLIRMMDTYATQQVEDPYKGAYALTGEGAQVTIAPTFDPYALMKLPVQNNTLGQCIEAMQTNIEGFGYTLAYIGPKDQEESAASAAEKAWITDLVEQPNPDESLTTIRRKLRADYETLGYAMLEIGRDNNRNIVFIFHAPSYSYRMTRRDVNPTNVDVYIRRDGKLTKQTIQKHFRRFVQMVGSTKRYFKEFGDPRPISPVTGQPDDTLSVSEQANEILMRGRYVPGEIYGLPRWINQLPSILGSRESEVTNLQFFKDNAIPALAVLVSGGLLTEQTVGDIETAFAKKGAEAMNRVLVIEAQGVADVSRAEPQSPSTPKLDIKPLAGERQQDGLFQTYDENNQKKIRSSFRLPPIFIGLTDDYTRATVEASLETADNQVFSPERIDIDDMVNTKLLLRGGKPPQFWKFRSNPPKLVSSKMILDSLKQFNEVGAMTPNLAIGLANEMLDLHIPQIKEDWGDMPFPFVEALILTGKLRPTGTDSLPSGLVPDDGNNGGKGGPTVGDAKKAAEISTALHELPALRDRVLELESAIATSDIRTRRRS